MRAQSAIEFMATYSWALIVIAVFIAVVGVLILSPTKGTATLSPSSCYLTPSLPCYQSVLLTNSSGSQFIALFQNNMGVSMYFPANAISLHPSYSSSTAYSGSCLPQTAPPGATVICNVSIATYSPAVGTQLYPTFTLSYQICPSCATAGAQSYNTSGTSTLTASSFSSVLYSVHPGPAGRAMELPGTSNRPCCNWPRWRRWPAGAAQPERAVRFGPPSRVGSAKPAPRFTTSSPGSQPKWPPFLPKARCKRCSWAGC